MNTREPEAAGGWPARGAIARRDLLEFIRDRRALFITLVMPMAMYPLLALSSTLGIRTAITEFDKREATTRLSLALSGPDAGAFAAGIETLARRPDGWPENLVVHLGDADEARRMIDEGHAEAWIDVAKGTMAGLAGEGTVPLGVRLSTVRAADHRTRDRVMAVMRGVADATRLARLQRAGLPASLIEPLHIDVTGGMPGAAPAFHDVLPSTVAAVLVLLALLTATGAFYPAIDAIAGEKERGTIETLLIAPCSPLDIVVGKFLAVFAVTLATLMANALSIALTATVLVRVLPAGSLNGPWSASLTGCAIVTGVAYVGLAAVAAALCLAVTAAARSAKEAQNTLTPVVMLIAALAGSALLPGTESRRWLPAVPFAGQVAVARAALVGDDGTMSAAGPHATDDTTWSQTVGLGLATSLLSSAALAWLLLQLTASLVSNEELLFRGPDTATKGLRRPAPRRSPSAWQGFAAALAGFTALWYAQGIAPADFVPALLTQQAVAVLLPLTAIAWWQRIDSHATYALRWPGTAAGTLTATAGAALVGGGLFVVGAAAALAVWGTDVSPEARRLAERLITLIRDNPSWLAVLVLAVMPAFCEELFFRGWVLSAFAGDRPPPRRACVAVAAQAAVFAAFHLLPERMPQTFALGIVLGWMTLATRSILPAIIAHAAHNATPVVLVANASPRDLSAIELGTVSGLPPWATAAAIGCVVGGGLLLAVARHGRTLRDSRP